MAAEIMPFGALFTLFTGAPPTVKRTLAAPYDISDTVLHSWLGTLNVIRNICAHHGRLWNRKLGFRPMIPNPRKHPHWHTPVVVPDDRIFAVLTILKHMLTVNAPQSAWPDRLRELLNQYPDIPRASMGFPPDWEECPIWQ
jgi:abortive infection bacteriophage resistance protein